MWKPSVASSECPVRSSVLVGRLVPSLGLRGRVCSELPPLCAGVISTCPPCKAQALGSLPKSRLGLSPTSPAAMARGVISCLLPHELESDFRKRNFRREIVVFVHISKQLIEAAYFFIVFVNWQNG